MVGIKIGSLVSCRFFDVFVGYGIVLSEESLTNSYKVVCYHKGKKRLKNFYFVELELLSP